MKKKVILILLSIMLISSCMDGCTDVISDIANSRVAELKVYQLVYVLLVCIVIGNVITKD